MKRFSLKPLILFSALILTACAQIKVPEDFVYREIQTESFTLASWQKIGSDPGAFRIYIEGDGYAFNAHGRVSSDPTPKHTLMRELAFGDPFANVVYLARPCQFVSDSRCEPRYWSTARFAPEVIEAVTEAIAEISRGAPVTLIGYSGGAQVAGLSAVLSEALSVQKIITIAGNLDHRAWCDYHHLPLLTQSLTLTDYQKDFQKIPQIHFVGERDRVIPPELTFKVLNNPSIIRVVPDATHDRGWFEIADEIYRN